MPTRNQIDTAQRRLSDTLLQGRSRKPPKEPSLRSTACKQSGNKGRMGFSTRATHGRLAHIHQQSTEPKCIQRPQGRQDTCTLLTSPQPRYTCSVKDPNVCTPHGETNKGQHIRIGLGRGGLGRYPRVVTLRMSSQRLGHYPLWSHRSVGLTCASQRRRRQARDEETNERTGDKPISP